MPGDSWSAGAASLMIRSSDANSNLRHGQEVVLYPSFGYLEEDGRTWRVLVSGTVYEPRDERAAPEADLRQRLLRRLLQRVMKVEPAALDTALFRQRIAYFVAATDKGRRVSIQMGSRSYRMQKKSKSNGLFRGSLRLAPDELDYLRAEGVFEADWLRYNAIVPGATSTRPGAARLIEPRGLSVISDIDDTIKHSEVLCRRSLLSNTFLREFTSVDGMAHVYQDWARQGAVFHYVSSSPWQLYRPLESLWEASCFPRGTFHLRSFRLRDHMLRRLLVIRRPGKGVAIRSLLQRFPQRRFVLVGDSGELDAEIYGAAARRFPGQVTAIWIRQLPRRPLDAARRRKAFRGLPDGICHPFEHPAELPRSLELLPVAS